MNSVKAASAAIAAFLSKWWPSLVLVAVVLFLALVPFRAYSAVAVGTEVPARIFCKDEATVKAHAIAIVEDGAYDRANALLKAALGDGSCIALPGPIAVPVSKAVPIGEPFKDNDGDTVVLTVLGVDAGNGRTFWTLHLEILKGA